MIMGRIPCLRKTMIPFNEHCIDYTTIMYTLALHSNNGLANGFTLYMYIHFTMQRIKQSTDVFAMEITELLNFTFNKYFHVSRVPN